MPRHMKDLPSRMTTPTKIKLMDDDGEHISQGMWEIIVAITIGIVFGVIWYF